MLNRGGVTPKIAWPPKNACMPQFARPRHVMSAEVIQEGVIRYMVHGANCIIARHISVWSRMWFSIESGGEELLHEKAEVNL